MPGELHGWGSLAHFGLWGSKRVGHNGVTKQQHIHTKTSYLKEAVFPLEIIVVSLTKRKNAQGTLDPERE